MKPEIYNLRYTIYERWVGSGLLTDSGCNRGTGDGGVAATLGDEASPLLDGKPMF